AVDDDLDALVLAVLLLHGQLDGGLDALEDDLARDPLLVVLLVQNPKQLGAFHGWFLILRPRAATRGPGRGQFPLDNKKSGTCPTFMPLRGKPPEHAARLGVADVGAGSPDPAPELTVGLPDWGKETFGQSRGTVGRPC